MHRGLRQFPSRSPDKFPQEAVEKMVKTFKRILANNRISDEKTRWLIDQALLVATFRQESLAEKRSRITTKINRHEEKGHRLGFKKEQILALNRLVAQKHLAGELEELSQELSKLKRREN